MGVYVEKPQEYNAMQFKAVGWIEVASWLRDQYHLDAFLVVPAPLIDAPAKHRQRDSFLQVEMMDVQSEFEDLGPRQIKVREGDWLVFNVGTRKWMILYDSEFQQNYKELVD